MGSARNCELHKAIGSSYGFANALVLYGIYQVVQVITEIFPRTPNNLLDVLLNEETLFRRLLSNFRGTQQNTNEPKRVSPMSASVKHRGCG